jgi:UDP-glucose 4-epimerase
MGRKLCIFGGGGFLGSAIIDKLLSEGWNLRVFERPGVLPHRSFGADEAVEWVEGDFANAKDISPAVHGMDAVLHLISTTRPKDSNADPVGDVQSNLLSSIQLLEVLRAEGPKKIVFISSGGTVYGEPQFVPITEDHPTNPLNSYGIVKLAIEKYLSLYRILWGLRPVILRVANPYGERQKVRASQGVVAAFVECALKRQPIHIWGDGSIVRDYLHVTDVANACACALRYNGCEEIFNIGSGAGVSLTTLVELLEGICSRHLEVVHCDGRVFDVHSNVLCINRAREELGWHPEINMCEGLSRTLHWLESQQPER